MTLEELLNKLIEKGWKPFDRNYQRYEHGCLIREFTTEDGVYSYGQYPTTYREFCSKESGLWQFVCENGMYKSVGFKYSYFCNTSKINYICNSYQYRLIETSLKNEDELEQFLLDNIKIDE